MRSTASINLRTASKSATVKQFFRSSANLKQFDGNRIEAQDGTALHVVKVTIGQAVSTVSYVRENDPSGRVLHCNLMLVPYSTSDACWCQPFDGPIHPQCPMHGEVTA